ncbi:MAG: FAD-dependent oxidoreductase [Desulfofustis sp.]
MLLDKGSAPLKRKCPIKENGCIKCNPCNILCGIGGAGLFSDGKLNFIHKLGKTDLTQFMSESKARLLINETEQIFNRFGMDGKVYPTDMQQANQIRKEARKSGIDLLIIKQKHLGSDNLPSHIAAMADYIEKSGVVFHFLEEAQDIIVDNGAVVGLITNKHTYRSKNIIMAPGRVGAEWVGQLARRNNIDVSQRGIEVGVRVEVHNEILQDICSVIYDPTFFIRTSRYDDQTRTFCTNFGGYVALENYQDFVCVNGHALLDSKSENSNFAFLSKVVLNDPVEDNQAYGESIGKLATLIGGGRPILQRYGDLKRGRRSTWNRVRNSYIDPTLKNVTCGDIAMALPERILSNIVDGLQQLNQIVPGVANDETMLYAPEIKFFATQVDTDNNLETDIKGLFMAGDGPGVAGNIVSATATALIPAKEIIGRIG